MAVEIGCRAIRARPYLKVIASDAAALMRAVGAPQAELSLSFVTDRAIRRLNRDFRGKDSATDVLSFPQFDPDAVAAAARAAEPPIPLGDIVISIETAARQARELNIRIAARLRTLLIHGMLHLLGYDHEASAAEARRMFKREHQLAALLAGDSSTPKTTPAGSAWSPAAMPPRRRSRRSIPRVRKRAGATKR